MKAAIRFVLAAGALALAACAVLTAPKHPAYVVCNETGTEPGCGDPVNIVVEDETANGFKPN